MAEPKKRLTSTRSGKRRRHILLKTKVIVQCPKCKNPILPHRVCNNCGFYRNDDVLKLEQKAKIKAEKRKQKEEELMAQEKQKDSDKKEAK